jgi:hypothetical protein
VKRLAGWWFAPAPPERLAALRILIGTYALVYLTARLPELYAVARYGAGHFEPVGIVRVLAAPLPPNVVLAIAVATCALLVGVIAGIAPRAIAPLAALALLWTLTYRNAWGQIFHTDNLLVLHIGVLALAALIGDGAGHGWPIKLMAALTAATYLVAGIAKLRIAGVDWIDGEVLRNHIAVDNLRKALLGDPIAPLARLVLDHPSPLIVFSVLTLVIELGAPLALLGRRIGHMWALGAWGFHVGVVLLMNIWFLYPLAGAAFLPLLPAERVVGSLRRLASKLRL